MSNILEYNEIVSYLGQPVKKDRKNAYWQCPECNDSGQDNLVYTFSNKLLKSWCCDSSKKIFIEIIKSRSDKNITQYKSSAKQTTIIPIKEGIDQKTIEKYQTYQHECCESLLKNEKALSFLHKKRGINKDTALFCGIGIDVKKRQWVIPIYDFNSLVGFEYRKSDFTDFNFNGKNRKCIKEAGTPSCLAQINGKLPEAKILIVLEGFFDGYVFWQYLKEMNQNEFYHILTPSCGVAGVVNPLKQLDKTQYEKVLLYLDSDDKGIRAMEEAKKQFPNLEVVDMNCGCKDFNEHYLKCIRRLVA